jgi:hypothetical protein
MVKMQRVLLRPVEAPARAGWRVQRPDTIVFVMLVAFLQGLVYLFLLPPWQHYDEPTHFEYAWLIANRDPFVFSGDVDQTMRREVAASMLQHAFYWNLPKPDLLTDTEEIYIGVSELSHPPLYYVLVSMPLRLARNLDIVSQLYIARMVSLVLLLITVVLTAGIVREITPSNHILRWAVPLILVLMPPVVDVMTAVNNDAGAIFIFCLFLRGAVRTLYSGITVRRVCWMLGTAFLAPLIKNTAASIVLLVPVVFLISLWIQHGWRRPIFFGLTLFGVIIAVVLDWRHLLSSSDSGISRLRFHPWLDQYLGAYLRLPPSVFLELVSDLTRITDLTNVAKPFSLLEGFFTGFAWGHVRIKNRSLLTYICMITTVAVAGCIRWGIDSTVNRHTRIWPVLLFLVVSAGTVWMTVILRALPIPGSNTVPVTARYAFPSVIPIVLMISGGWWALWPQRARVWGTVVLLLLLFSLNLLSVQTIFAFYMSLPAQ